MNIQNVPLLNAMSVNALLAGGRIHDVPVSTASPPSPVLLQLSPWST